MKQSALPDRSLTVAARFRLFFCFALISLLSACGYHVGGRADMLPKTIKVIAVPAFGNATTQPKLPALLTAEVKREFISRTKYAIVSDPSQADAVLNGAVITAANYPTVFDPQTNRATGVQSVVTLHITLTDRRTGAVLFSRNPAEFRERYEISIDPQAYFDENDTAMLRLSRYVARELVTAILENF